MIFLANYFSDTQISDELLSDTNYSKLVAEFQMFSEGFHSIISFLFCISDNKDIITTISA